MGIITKSNLIRRRIYEQKRIKRMIGIAIPLFFIIIGICYGGYIKAHTFTLAGDEQIQAVTGTVKVTSPYDTEVIFIDVKTGNNYAIPYITSGSSENISLEKVNGTALKKVKDLQ